MKIFTAFILMFFTFIPFMVSANTDCFAGLPIRNAFTDGNHTINILFDSSEIRNLKTINTKSSIPLNLLVNNNGNDIQKNCYDAFHKSGARYVISAGLNYKTSKTSGDLALTSIDNIALKVAFHMQNGKDESIPYKSSGNISIMTDAELQKYSGYFTVDLMQLGSVTQSGYLKGGIIADKINNYDNTVDHVTANLTLNENSIYINVLSCSLKNNQNTYNINMGDWYDTQFKNINDTQGTVAIPIALSCLSGTNIKVTVTSDTIDNAANGRLGLTGTDKATGIAVQLLNNAGTPIVLNQKLTQQDNVAQGDYIFGWKARYIKTAATITPGTANANATVNILYE